MTDGKELLNDPVEWGAALLVQQDADPIYDMLAAKFTRPDGGSDAMFNFDIDMMAKWLLAYWCFYHAGVASYMAKSSDLEIFWHEMLKAADNSHLSPKLKRWPRSPERRHFRGGKCVEAVMQLRDKHYDPVDLMNSLSTPPPLKAEEVINRAKALPQFGPWIAFKVADMLERVWGADIRFSLNVAMYDSPREGLHEAIRVTNCPTVLDAMLERYKHIGAPGIPSRGCGIQEVETVLCKWKSARGGHYHIGKDLHEIREGLQGWGWLADEMAVCLPRELEAA